MLSRNDKPPDIWNTHGISGNVFVNPPASSSSPYPGGSNHWISSNATEDTSPHVTSERQNPDTTLDPRCQSGPSARDSFDPCDWRFSKDDGADQQRLQISDPRFDKFPAPTTFACWKIRFKTEVCTCSQFLTEAMLWIKEVEVVWISGWSQIFALYQRNSWSELWVVRRENCFSTEQNHPEYPLQEKGQSGGNESSQRRPFPSRKDRWLTWSTNTSGSLVPTMPSRIMPTYLQLLFEKMVFRNSIRNETKFYSRWRKSHLMTSWKACTN